ncbi:MAG: tRNA uridine-5-carboxymethylaminomethyl(34) synthesis enzyme MnmG [Chloroflexi bacterium]|nr:tRNA uridine-5-carboxymethylaminomethyl(34) synthesis enzyme MnmG [Chloroflexota bacterium]
MNANELTILPLESPDWWTTSADGVWDVVVVGAGHAGAEASLAAARMGARVLVVTATPTAIASMPCNPSIGGPAKGHLVREIDALGGVMGRAADLTALQIRMLNTGKGPAVRALRAQCDKHLYASVIGDVLLTHPGITIRQGMVTGLVTVDILTTGTFLDGRLVCGDTVEAGGRFGEGPSLGLSSHLASLGLTLSRHKTGTPPRVDARTIDFSKSTIQPGSDVPLGFAHEAVAGSEVVQGIPHPAYPGVVTGGWRTAIGPRYCPSFEAKVVRFAEKERHQFFLEPEGFDTEWIYVQGANTSLPEEVQASMLATIPALSRATILRPGYAVEYDYVPAWQTLPSLESRAGAGLFLAGQINGTSGYEEAAAQGLLAGINATLRGRALRTHGPWTCHAAWTPWLVNRSQAYLGVMIDDLTTQDYDEPYRLHTSRAEYRLLLRHDNADLRLTPEGVALGLVNPSRGAAVEAKRDRIASALASLAKSRVVHAHNEALVALGFPPVLRACTAQEYLCRPDVGIGFVEALGDEAFGLGLPDDVAAHVEVETKYAGYVKRQHDEVARVAGMDGVAIPLTVDFAEYRPMTVGQASRIAGVTPADVAVLLVRLKAG